MYKIEDKPIIRTNTKGSPIRDALAEALANLKVGQSFEVKNKGRITVALQLAKEMGLLGITSTTVGGLRVGKVDPATIKPHKTKSKK